MSVPRCGNAKGCSVPPVFEGAGLPSASRNVPLMKLHAQDPRTRTRYPVQWVRLLFTVTETFTVEGRGIVLLPEVRLAAEDEFRAGDTLMLKRPDGVEVTVRIAGRELLKTLGGKCHFVVMLPKGEEGVPIGTEVWSADRS